MLNPQSCHCLCYGLSGHRFVLAMNVVKVQGYFRDEVRLNSAGTKFPDRLHLPHLERASAEARSSAWTNSSSDRSYRYDKLSCCACLDP